MKVYGVQFKDAQLKIAEEAVTGALNVTNSLDGVSDQILSIAVQTRDENLKSIVQSEMEDRERRRQGLSRKERFHSRKILTGKKCPLISLTIIFQKAVKRMPPIRIEPICERHRKN